MRQLIGLFGFENEANLLDSKTYILKSFLAVATAYGIVANSELISRDMISVLFGLMLTLEPVTLTGIRHGWHQMYATILGALSTAVIISIFGIHMITISLSVAFTLYVCLKINWREVSPVAIFTSIYMTQYVQLTDAGQPSIILTIQLRLMALGTGVVVAILFNLLFAFFSYRKMAYKRIDFLVRAIVVHMEKNLVALKTNDRSILEENQKGMSKTFNNIDWVYGFFKDIKEEKRIMGKIIGDPSGDTGELIEIAMDLRSVCHLNYDVNLYLLREKEERLFIYDHGDQIFEKLHGMIIRLTLLKDDTLVEDRKKISKKKETMSLADVKVEHKRVYENLSEMESLITSLEYRIGNLKGVHVEIDS